MVWKHILKNHGWVQDLGLNGSWKWMLRDWEAIWFCKICFVQIIILRLFIWPFVRLAKCLK